MSDATPPIDATTRHVRGAVHGDARSLHWLVERFSPLLHAVAAERLGPRLRGSYDPADVVQDVWTAVLPKLASLELQGPRTTPTVLKYLTTAVINRIRNLLARHLARQLSDEADDGAIVQIQDPASGILTRAMRAENAERVHRAIEDLGERDRLILILRGIEQRSLPAVAQYLGLEPGTVAVRFHRALNRLQTQLPDSVFADLEAPGG
ncbi:MAG: sigma-70 family RNA polymerase sigma factor [Planctomycetota bacterium]